MTEPTAPRDRRDDAPSDHTPDDPGRGEGAASGKNRANALAGRRFAAIIFDMDGTLVDSTNAIVRAWTDWAIEFGVTEEQLRGHHGRPSADVVRQVVAPDRVEAAIERINALELADVADVIPLPGSVEALRGLPADRAAIATSCSAPLARARLAAAGIEVPSVLVTVDDVDRGKPAPDPFLKAAERLGVAPEECLVVEDAVAGLAAAEAAGCARLAVVTTTPPEELRADLVVEDLAAVRFVAEGGSVRLELA